MEENKTYNASDFERYYNGSMPGEEMHALEKAALNDAFLADALEGYANTRSAINDLSDLRSRLHEKYNKKKIVPLFSINGWWRIAALFVLITGVGSGLYLWNRNKSTNEIVKTEIKQQIPVPNNQPASTDSAGFGDVASAEKPSEKNEASKKIIQSGVLNKTDNNDKQNKNSAKPDSIKANTGTALLETKTPQRENFSDNNLQNKYLLKGRVLDDKGHPLPSVVIHKKNSRDINTTDDAGNFSLATTDSSVIAFVSAPGYQSKEVKLKKDSISTVVVFPVADAFDEVVVTSSDKSVKPFTQGMKDAKVMKNVVTDTLGDDTRFNQYIITHQKAVYDSNNVPLTGNVTLSFIIDEDGLPKGIKVIKSTCKGCEGNAIDLVKKAPAWTNKKEKKTVMISY